MLRKDFLFPIIAFIATIFIAVGIFVWIDSAFNNDARYDDAQLVIKVTGSPEVSIEKIFYPSTDYTEIKEKDVEIQGGREVLFEKWKELAAFSRKISLESFSVNYNEGDINYQNSTIRYHSSLVSSIRLDLSIDVSDDEHIVEINNIFWQSLAKTLKFKYGEDCNIAVVIGDEVVYEE